MMHWLYIMNLATIELVIIISNVVCIFRQSMTWAVGGGGQVFSRATTDHVEREGKVNETGLKEWRKTDSRME